MKALSLIFILLCFSICNTSNAVMMDGYATCGQWVSEGGWAHKSDRAWILGYLSGKAASTGEDVLRNTDKESIALWMDQYCKNNPLNDTADGARTLFKELIKRH